MSASTTRVGVFGGSGLYELVVDGVETPVSTPWGSPSANPVIGRLPGRDDIEVVFIPRHGVGHTFPPHRVPYRANVAAMYQLGVRTLVAPCAVGSLRLEVKPGDVVVPDQLIDRTSGRDQTFFDGPVTFHAPFADPYCASLRSVLVAASRAQQLDVHDGGTGVVIQGPRFSSGAESAWHRSNGWTIVGMTQLPEATLARELGMCYASLALVTDYDTGVDESHADAVTHAAVLEAFSRNIGEVRAILGRAVATVDQRESCTCAESAGPLDTLFGA